MGSLFVYASKEDSDGFVTQFKARLVAKGYSQKKGRDYFDTYAPVGNTVGHRVFFAIAAWRKVAPRNADCTQAFVNADTDVMFPSTSSLQLEWTELEMKNVWL